MSTGRTVLAAALVVLLLVVMVGGLLAGLVMAARGLKRRREAFLALAAAEGLRLLGDDDGSVRSVDPVTVPTGVTRHAADVLTGTRRGRAVTAFTLHWTERADRDSVRRYADGVVQVLLPGIAFPRLVLTPQRWRDDAAAATGLLPSGADVTLDDEGFDRRWRVSCADARFAYDLLSPRALELLLAVPLVIEPPAEDPRTRAFRPRSAPDPGTPDVVVSVAGDRLEWRTPGRPIEPETVLERFDLLLDVLDAAPSFLLDQHRATGEQR